MFENILLAVDGSEHSLKAARKAGELVRVLNSKTLRVMVVFGAIPSYLGEPNMQDVLNARLREAEAIMDSALAEIGNVEAELHTELLEGSVAEEILRVADVRKVDLIVMGSRGLGTLALLLGSNSQKVVSHAHCPVLIVR